MIYHHEWLPKVGDECEVATYVDDLASVFSKCKVLYISNVYSVVDRKGLEVVIHLQNVIFRPLKTERDEAIEAMVNGIDYATANCHEVKIVESICAKLYDYGYRKADKWKIV